MRFVAIRALYKTNGFVIATPVDVEVVGIERMSVGYTCCRRTQERSSCSLKTPDPAVTFQFRYMRRCSFVVAVVLRTWGNLMIWSAYLPFCM